MRRLLAAPALMAAAWSNFAPSVSPQSWICMLNRLDKFDRRKTAADLHLLPPGSKPGRFQLLDDHGMHQPGQGVPV